MFVSPRRPLGTREELLVFLWSEGPLEFIDASSSLHPYSEYEYRVRALNSKGSVSSTWASALTQEAPPVGMSAPWAQPASAYSLKLNWTQPSDPNGLIQQYRVIYQRRPSDPTLNMSAILALTVPVRQDARLAGRWPLCQARPGRQTDRQPGLWMESLLRFERFVMGTTTAYHMV